MHVWLILIALFTVATPAQTAAAKETVGLRSWGYQLQNTDPARLVQAPYDVLVIDYSRDGTDAGALKLAEIEALKFKPDGSRRVVLAYLSIGEAESYRYYWRSWWGDAWMIPNVITKPGWRGHQNREWGGNYAVRYWEPAWQNIIVGPNGYLDRILNAGFDGVWLDKVDSSVEEIAKGRPSAKAEMIRFVMRIAEKGRAARPGFLVFPQNGEELLSDTAYRTLIDGFGKEDLLYGEEEHGIRNRTASTRQKAILLRQLVAEGKPVLAVEYLDERAAIDAARQEIAGYGFVPYFADRSLASLRVGDYPPAQVASREPTAKKSRVRERTTYEIWRTRVLVAAAGIILLMGLMRRQRSY